jgi:hypothetical protein
MLLFELLKLMRIFGDYLRIEYLRHAPIMPPTNRNGISSQIAQDDGSIYANLVLSIPSPEFEKALDELRGLGKEVTTDTSGGRT